MGDGLRVAVHGFRFTGERFTHQPGAYIVAAEGLNDGGEVTYEAIDRIDGDGEFDTPSVRSGSRIITLTGFLYNPSVAALGHQIDALNGVLAASTDRTRFTWAEFSRYRWTHVRRGRGSRIVRRGSTGFADYTVRFRAPSQVIYGETHIFPEGEPANPVVARHYGNFPATPVLEVWGSSPTGYTITGPGGRQIVVTRPLTSMLPHTIDLANGGLFVDGVRQLGHMPTFQPWTIPPGQPVSMSMSTGRLRVKVMDEFV